MLYLQSKKLSGIFFLSIALFLTQCSIANSEQSEKKTTPRPKNIIYFIGDGMGFNQVKATNYFESGQTTGQVYEQQDWTQLALATYPSILSFNENDTVYTSGYSPQEASQNADYVRRGATDSGAAGTALSTGKKTYAGSIGLGVNGDTLIHISQAAKALGKSTGILSSVQLSHATPASFVAHNNRRNNYLEIAQYMLFHSQTDVIMTAGNPDYNNDGEPEELNARFVGGREIWEMLKANDGRIEFPTQEQNFRVQDSNGDGSPTPWTLIQEREEFQNFATGNTPARVLGVAKAHATLNQGRSHTNDDNADNTLPFDTPLNQNVPTLQEMTKAAINVLNQNPEGFFMMVEGGAIDWAGHSNQSDRMIEELMDFNNAIHAAVEWVENHSSWDETLIIVTSDHETGYLTGPGDPDPLYSPVTNNGKGNLPGMQWNSGGHTNTLVPFYAKGPGTDIFNLMAGETDPIYGSFIQNSDVPQAIFLMWGKPEIKVHKLN